MQPLKSHSLLSCYAHRSSLKGGDHHKQRFDYHTKQRPDFRKLKSIRRRSPPSKGFPEKERPNARPLPPLDRRNPQALCKEVLRLARDDNLKDALAVMSYMDDAGIPTNATAFAALIACCIRLKSLWGARQVHVYLRINGLDANEFLRKNLVLMYTSLGSMEDAKKLFDELPSRNVYSWNALIRGSVVAGRKKYRDVISMYNEMRAQGVELDFYTVANVVKSLAGASSVKLGYTLHGNLLKSGFIVDDMIKTCMIDLYFKCGRVRFAHQLFEEISTRDIVVWGAMIAGFAHNRRHWEALDYVRWMTTTGINPNSVILTTVLPVAGEISARRIGQELHAYTLKKNYARRVFYQSAERNAISWTALMSGYASNGLFDQALRSIVWMQQEGYKPDVVTIATAIPVCKEMKALKHGKELHAYSIKNLFFPNVSVSTSLISLYSECKALSYSAKVFGSMGKRNLISCTAIIDAHMKNGEAKASLQVFRVLVLSMHHVDAVVTARMLNICGETKSLKLGKEMHAQALKRGFDSIPFVAADVIRMYGCCGKVQCAEAAFDAIDAKGSMTWTAMIEAHGLNDELQRAVEAFVKMMKMGIAPTHYTFDLMLGICHRGGYVDEALRIIMLMTRRCDVRPTKLQYSLVVGLLSRSGREEEARMLTNIRSLLS